MKKTQTSSGVASPVKASHLEQHHPHIAQPKSFQSITKDFICGASSDENIKAGNEHDVEATLSILNMDLSENVLSMTFNNIGHSESH